LSASLQRIASDAQDARRGRRTAVPALGPQDDEAADDEGTGHHHRREQVRLDRLAEQQAQHDRREEGDRHVERKALRLLLVRQLDDGVADLLPVDDDDRQDGAGLDRDVEDLGLGVVHAEQRARQDQVSGGRDRQKLGQALDDAHHGRLGQQHCIHAYSYQERGLSPPPAAPRRRSFTHNATPGSAAA
jgi:hypothetical protein